jgi:hypothetical protein
MRLIIESILVNASLNSMFDVCKYFDKLANCFKTSDAKSYPKIKPHWLIDKNNDDACDAVLELQIIVV